MNSEMKRRMAESVRGFRLPRYNDLPDVGLYLEQTTKYLNGFLEPLGCMEITPTMVSNYVKKGIIPKPVKKLYYAEHIAYLFFVVVAKSLVSMENISMLVSVQRDTYTLPVAYDFFCEDMENTLFYLFGLKDSIDELGVTDTDEKDLLHNLVFSACYVIFTNCYFDQLREQSAH